MNKYTPTEKQTEFINNSNEFLIVSAGPGSGKTATIVEYLNNIVENVSQKQIIVSSFTKNSTNEINNRFIKKYPNHNKNIFFQTFDSFLITKIWKFYFNRILKFTIEKFGIIHTNEFGYEQKTIVYSIMKWDIFNKNYGNHDWISGHASKFVDHGKKGELLVNFVSEYILLEFIKNNEEVGKYLSANFKKIIIDEAQDLSKLRYDILIYLHEMYKIEIVLVGDERQSIFKFLGAINKVFKTIIKEKTHLNIKIIDLTKNFRYSIPENSDDSIIKIIQSKDEKDFKTNLQFAIDKKIIEEIAYDKIFEKIMDSDSNLFLTKTNYDLEKISQNLINNEIKNRALFRIPPYYKVSHENQIFIENIYIYNQIKLGKIKYSLQYSNLVNEICDFIWPFDPYKNDKFLKLFWNNKSQFNDIIKEVIKLTKINNFEKIIDLFSNNDNYLKNISSHKNKVMTYHSAKGLEGDNIFINKLDVELFLSGNENNNSPTFNEMYVAISRVKSKIYLIK